MRGIIILHLNKKSGPAIIVQYPEAICEDLQISTSGLLSLIEQHKIVKTGPNYLEMQIKRNVSVASFFTGHSQRSFLGKPDHAITIFLSDDDTLPKTFEGQVRRIAFELLPNIENPEFYDEFVRCFELLKRGELDPYYQQMIELTQDIGTKRKRIDDLAQKVSMLVSDRSDHLRNVDELKDEINGLYTKLDSWSAQMAELNEYNANLTVKIRDFNRSSKIQKETIQQKEEQILKLKNIIEEKNEIENGAEKLLTQSRKFKLENERLNQNIEKLNETNKNLKFQVIKLKRENEEGLNSIEKLELENKKLTNKTLGMSNERQNVNQQLIDLKKEIKVLRRDRDQYLKIVKKHDLL
ncbi:hypothetical protein LCGC14_0564280 [marine sediment metagenome]|uniref:Uncharacterized protein n=1 Tax=marine sediment metagenome TaxID=412755 RepID=A0A0F9RKW5_9ZZZZ|nr:MAG: hypothetical protein Lokiarch_37350 [Candidatus Lokiarchaeum sp. GC14_75]